MISKNKELLIFDLDGTLINSIPDLTVALNSMLDFYGKSALTVEQATPFVGNGARVLVDRALKYAFGEDELKKVSIEEALALFLKAYESNVCEGTFLYEGVKETLAHLKNKGYQLVICTNKPLVFVEPILKKLEIMEFFDFWLGAESVAEKKPSAMPLLYIAEYFGLTVEKCLMIGDSSNDILAAHNANMESVGLTYGYNYNEHISLYEPTVIRDKFEDLKMLF